MPAGRANKIIRNALWEQYDLRFLNSICCSNAVRSVADIINRAKKQYRAEAIFIFDLIEPNEAL